jgi:putative transposase
MVPVVSVIKLRLFPDARTAECLDDQSRKCNSLYNRLLERANQLKQEFKSTGNSEYAKILYTPRGLRNLVPGIKNEHPYLKSVYAAPLKNTALRLTDCIKVYQDSHKGKRAGMPTGWPRFRSWKAGWFSLFYDEPNKGYSVEGNVLSLSLGLGIDRKRHALKIPIINAHMLIGKKIRTLRITKEDDTFSAVFTIIRMVPDTKPIKKIIALDPNHKNLAYGVDNEGIAIEIQAPHWLKIYDKRLDGIKSKLDRCKKKSRLITVTDEKGVLIKQRWEASRRFKKLSKTYKKALAKRRDQTKSFCYRSAHILFKRYDLVAIGDYAPHGNGITTPMRRAMNNRSLIGRFKEIASWVAIKSGKAYQEFPEKGTTRTCNACGFVMEGGIHPSVRKWACPGCNINHLRDENAACNGLIKVLRNLNKESEESSSPVPGSGHVPIKERWAWRVLSSGAVMRCGGKIADLSAPTRN